MRADAEGAAGAAAAAAPATLHRRSRGGSRQDLKAAAEEEEQDQRPRADADADAAPSSPPPLSTARRHYPLSLLLLAFVLFGLASVAVVGGLQMVSRARASSSSRNRIGAAAAAEAATTPTTTKTKTKTNDPHHITVAIADLHGDWPHAVVALRASGVISESGARYLPTPSEAERDWRLAPSDPQHTLPLSTAKLFDLSQVEKTGTLHLVQTGDLVDRGRHGLALVRLFGALRDVARRGRNGGGNNNTTATATVSLLLGNHELLNLQGDAERYAHADELRAVAEAEGIDEQQGAQAWARLLGPKGDLGQALRNDRAIAHVAGRGPCRTLFVHAGLTPGLLVDLLAKVPQQGNDKADSDNDNEENQPSSVRAINRAAAAALAECTQNSCPRDLGNRHPLGPLLLSGQGPVWTRALAPDGRGGSYRSNNQLALVCAAVDDVLRRVGGGARRLVVGHTITRTDGSPTVACGGRLVFLDVGMSSAMWTGDEDEGEGEGDDAPRSPPFAGPSPALALRCEFGGSFSKPGAAELVFARPKRGHERDDPRTAPLDVRRMALPALGEVPRAGVAAAAAG